MSPPVGPDLDRATVLVVDDTAANLTLLAQVLTPHYRVLLATSGAKSLEIARRSPPDLILLDVMKEYVRTLARWLATQAGHAAALSTSDVDQMARAAPLYDIGKVAIPDRVLLKPGKLDPAEWARMQTHVQHGADLLQRASDRLGDDAGPTRNR